MQLIQRQVQQITDQRYLAGYSSNEAHTSLDERGRAGGAITALYAGRGIDRCADRGTEEGKYAGGIEMTLDWTAQPVPGKSVFNLDLGTSFANVVAHLKEYEVSEGILQLASSSPMRLKILQDEQVILFKKLEDEIYDWQSDVALLAFEGHQLVSITTYLNEPYSYQGLICEDVGLGDEIRRLEEYFRLEYDNVEEVYLAIEDDVEAGLELHGTSCDLSIDPTQKMAAMKVFLADRCQK
ncbi:hypothetical protein [Herbaspirillum huttiense]|uniref:hypothetical protein n=1 Tax=Herbaspirillum huttiense TaxID=863372 RepID=UPI0023EF707F|nr:hypothetical protein [Herbaspirillum huttiense]